MQTINKGQIAIQLYTVRQEAQRDLSATLEQLAGMGYQAVELAGYYGLTSREVRERLDGYGLKAVSAHVGLKDWDQNSAQVLEDLATLGCTFAIVPWVGEEYRQNRNQWQKLAARLNQLGDLSQKAGLRFGYHNHNFEFNRVAGESSTLWEVLVSETDPALVGLEIDLYWAKFAGGDPLELLQKYAGRVPLLHFKDIAATEQREDVPVGEGSLPWQQIINLARKAQTEWYIVEQDRPRDALNDVKKSLDNLQKMVGQAAPV